MFYHDDNMDMDYFVIVTNDEIQIINVKIYEWGIIYNEFV